MKQLTASEMENKLNWAGINPDKLFKSKGLYVARMGFYYRHGQTAEKWAEKFSKLPGVTVESSREVWQPWPKDSFFEVKFTYAEQEA